MNYGRTTRAKAIKSNGSSRGALSDISNRNYESKKRGSSNAIKKPRSNRAALRPKEVSKKSSRTRSRPSSAKSIPEPAEDLMRMDIDNMEDLAGEEVDEKNNFFMIDAQDMGNCLTLAEYANDIYAYHRSAEAASQASPTYMTRQRDINARMREILVDWLVEVHLKFKLEQETLFLTVNLIDRFLERREVTRNKLQLVGCAAMLLGSKYEEIYAPEVRDFVYISDQAYTHEQILAMETIMLNALGFDLTVPSALKFADRFIKVVDRESDEAFRMTVYYLLEITLQDYSFIKYLPSMVAASAMHIALRATASSSIRDASYTPLLQRYTQYSPEQLRPCMSAMWALVQNNEPRYRAVRSKYASSKFQSVSRNSFDAAHCPFYEAQ